MKTKLVQVDAKIRNTKEMFEALLQGKVLEIGRWNVELLPSGVLNVDLESSVESLVRGIDKVYEYQEIPWYECMEVGQTVLCKGIMDGKVFLLTKGGECSWYWGGVRANVATISTLDKHVPLTPEEVSKFAFDNVCN